MKEGRFRSNIGKKFCCEGGKVAQPNCGLLSPGNVEDQAGWCSELPAVVKGVPDQR